MKSLPGKLSNHRVFIFSVIVFLLFFGLAMAKPVGIFWSLDEGGKWIYLENVLRTGNPRAPLIYPGRALDGNLENVALYFYTRIGQHIYTWWPVGFPLLTIPFYKLMGWAGLYLLPALAGAISVYFSGKITQQLLPQSKNAPSVVVWMVALATPVAFYSTTFWEHTLSLACIMVTLYGMLTAEGRNSLVRLVICGLAGSLAVFFRLEAGLILLGAGIAFLIADWKRAMPFVLGGAGLTLVWVSCNLWLTGHLIGSNMDSIQSGVNFAALKMSGVRFVAYVLFNSPTIGAFDLGKGLLAVVTLLAMASFGLGLFRKTIWLSALVSSGVTAICAYVLLQPALYRSVHGFVLICPFVLLSSWVIGAQFWKKNKLFWLMCGLGLVAYAIVYILRAWVSAGGLQWGPRYMLALYPILVIAAVCGIQEMAGQLAPIKRAMVIAAAGLAILVGIGFEIRGYVTMYLTMDLYDRSATTLRTLKDRAIKTECTWMPMVIPDLYWNGNIFTTTKSEKWEKNLKKTGQNTYLLVKMDACDTDPIDQELQKYSIIPDGLEIEEMPLNN